MRKFKAIKKKTISNTTKKGEGVLIRQEWHQGSGATLRELAQEHEEKHKETQGHQEED
jgi:hypothetical protein